MFTQIDMKKYINLNSTAKRILYSVGIAALFCFMSSCKKFVDVSLPDSQLTATDVFQDYPTANAALGNIYAQLRSGDYSLSGGPDGFSILLGDYADEFQSYNTQNIEEIFYQNALRANSSVMPPLWNTSYNTIYQANAVISGTEQSSTISASDKNKLIGEALFVRADMHFYLLNLFGAIPYITSTDFRINSKVHRMPVDSVYAAIIADLKKAETLLPAGYTTVDRTHPNSSVASALLARVYLYHQQWALAEAEASQVIDNTTLYTLENDLDQVFLKTSTGTLWQFSPIIAGNNTLEAQSFIFEGTPPDRAMTDSLVAAFEPGDLRMTHWVGSTTDGTNTFYFPYKYKLNNPTPTSQEYSIVFRIEEQYLIRAEARAQQGNLTGARDDLNQIRTRRGLTNTSATTSDGILAAILHERRVEFFSEFGHRFFDLKRTGHIDEVLSKEKPNWNSTDALWPIPANELLLNPNLKPQNPGY